MGAGYLLLSRVNSYVAFLIVYTGLISLTHSGGFMHAPMANTWFIRLRARAKEEHVLFTPYDAAYAFKATFPRLVPAGDFGDTDVYGCQQHAPLLDVDLPI